MAANVAFAGSKPQIGEVFTRYLGGPRAPAKLYAVHRMQVYGNRLYKKAAGDSVNQGTGRRCGYGPRYTVKAWLIGPVGNSEGYWHLQTAPGAAARIGRRADFVDSLFVGMLGEPTLSQLDVNTDD